VKYPFKSSITGATFGKQTMGTRTFDINVDGLSNVGMLPDFIEELKVLGLTDQDLEPLYSSAEGYIQTWEKADLARAKVKGEVRRLAIGGGVPAVADVSWETASNYCTDQYQRLATQDEVCPGGPGSTSVYGQPEGDVWMAVGDHSNAWVSIGTSNPDRRCKLHDDLGAPPSWGTTTGPEAVTGQPAALKCVQGVTRVSVADTGGSFNWNEAEKSCEDAGLRLASLAEVCPLGDGRAPVVGQPVGDVWMAVSDHPNAWVSIGTKYPNRRCGLHENLGGPPAWGTDKGPEPATGEPAALLCRPK
jgi:hypothetical protein